MPKWQPAPEPLVRRFLDAIAPIADAPVRKMFGYPAVFRSGNLFAGLFQDALIVRLAPEDRAALLAHAGARPFEPMPGRPMREYVVVPPRIVATKAALGRWLAKRPPTRTPCRLSPAAHGSGPRGARPLRRAVGCAQLTPGP
jgi:TfoX/Sxy family transcriptional regulator of competence genes